MATGRIGTTPVLRTRWSKEPAGGTTSLSGLDDYSVSLVYEVGYEAVYQNGALLSRGNDYTATDGTTITLTNATVAGDIIEVFANNVVPLTDTYSQSVADGKFVNNTIVDAKGDLIVGSAADTFTKLAVGSANQVLTVDSATTSGLKWATPDSGKVIQIVTASTSSTLSTTSTTYADITGLSATITPTSASNKILVCAILPYTSPDVSSGPNTTYGGIQLLRGATKISETFSGWYYGNTATGNWIGSMYLNVCFYNDDAPATTSATTYKLQHKWAAGTTFYSNVNPARATLTLMEIA